MNLRRLPVAGCRYPITMFTLLAFVTSALSSLLLCRFARRLFSRFFSREQREGKEKIYQLFPRLQKPMGGGVALLVALTLGIAVAGFPSPTQTGAFLAAVWGFGLIGLADDLSKARSRGLGFWTKLGAQAAIALGYALYLKLKLGYGVVYLPFVSDQFALGWWFVPVGALVLVAASNSVNLADGVDGLAAGSFSIAAAAFLLIGLLAPMAASAVPLLAACSLGASLGFLAYNYPPARLIMGDAGALALGSALGAFALISRTEWLLLLVGAVFVLEALSVIVQTWAVHLFRGTLQLLRHRTTEIFRPFLCTPIHHHFQWLGWGSRPILQLFWGVAAFYAVVAFLGLYSDWIWLAGLGGYAALLVTAGLQKSLRANYFLGLEPGPDGSSRVALYKGVPAQVFGRRLYEVCQVTPLTEQMLVVLAAESILWRPISELESHVALGKLYAEHRMFDQAVLEWEQVPPRNLLLREQVLHQLARIYYSRDQLLLAIKLWERLPEHRFRAAGLEQIVPAAKLRLADLASKSHRQSLRHYRQSRAAARRGEEVSWPGVAEALDKSCRFNQDLLALLRYEQEKMERSRNGSLLPIQQRQLFRKMERTVLERLRDLERAQQEVRQGQQEIPLAVAAAPIPADQLTRSACAALGITPGQLGEALEHLGEGVPQVLEYQVSDRPSRNQIIRLTAEWEGGSPCELVVKRYDERRISFFSACYRRERGLLELLGRYGCAVPRVEGGLVESHHALLFMEDAGRETLADLLAESGEGAREALLRGAIDRVVSLHWRTHGHLPEIQQEVLKIDKESLTEGYYLNAFRIALGRISELTGRQLSPSAWRELEGEFLRVAELLAGQPKAFIHFELVPDHLLLQEGRITLFDFEQATLGPAEFDLVTLLKCPESDLPEPAVERLLSYYNQAATAAGREIRALRRKTFDHANFLKSIVLAGAAANFYRRFGEQQHLRRMEWYLKDARAAAARRPELAGLERLLSPQGMAV